MSTIEKETDIYNSNDPVDTSVNHDDSLSGSGSEADPLALNVQHDDSLSGSGSEADPLKATNIIYITATKELDNSLTCNKTFNEIAKIINDGKQLPIINFTDKVYSYSFKFYYHGFDDADNIKKYKFASCDNYHYNDNHGFITSFHITDEISNNLYFKNIRVIEKLNVLHDDSLNGSGIYGDELKLNIQHDISLSGDGTKNNQLSIFKKPSIYTLGITQLFKIKLDSNVVRDLISFKVISCRRILESTFEISDVVFAWDTENNAYRMGYTKNLNDINSFGYRINDGFIEFWLKDNGDLTAQTRRMYYSINCVNGVTDFVNGNSSLSADPGDINWV